MHCSTAALIISEPLRPALPADMEPHGGGAALHYSTVVGEVATERSLLMSSCP
jgi:hypothetical protein